MAKRRRISKKQFNKIAKSMRARLFPPEKPEVAAATDCDAILAFIQSAQEIYTRDCPIAQSS